ncbi:hypothetical protein DMJ13_09770 [halophilic archaeon]|nr:hypothetical protein DMJ13_09770 [halophilic archaeon]
MDGETAFRLVVAGVLVVAPTMLFLGLWRGLMALRNDDLANRTLNGEFGPISDGPIPARVFDFAAPNGGRGATADESFVRCPNCQSENPNYVDYCGDCLEPLG